MNKRTAMFNKYPINVFYSEPDGGYIADAPDLEYCSAFGETPEDAVRELGIAMLAWLASARDNNIPIPPPSYIRQTGAEPRTDKAEQRRK